MKAEVTVPFRQVLEFSIGSFSIYGVVFMSMEEYSFTVHFRWVFLSQHSPHKIQLNGKQRFCHLGQIIVVMNNSLVVK